VVHGHELLSDSAFSGTIDVLLHTFFCPHNLGWDGRLPSHSLPPPVPPGVVGLVTSVHVLFSLTTVDQTRSTVERTDRRTLEKANGNILELRGIPFGLSFLTHVFFPRQRTSLFRGLFASAGLDLASSSKSATTPPCAYVSILSRAQCIHDTLSRCIAKFSSTASSSTKLQREILRLS
jgi:hypothetical protein